MTQDTAAFDVRVEVREGKLRAAAWATSERLDRIALVVDFRRLRALLEAALAERPTDATAPALADWLLARLHADVDGEPYRIAAVEVGDEEGISFIRQAETSALPRASDPDPHRAS